MRYKQHFRILRARTFFAFLFAAIALVPAACSKKPAPEQNARRYHLVGKVVSIDAEHNSLNIDGQEIPGFMAAMTMDYAVRSAQSLTGLNVGDEITADLIVPSDSSGTYIENIMVTKKAGA